jgi:hypothetical protein
MIEIIEGQEQNRKELAFASVLSNLPLYEHSIAIRMDGYKDLYIAPTCDFPPPMEDNKKEYDACLTKKIYHLDIKVDRNDAESYYELFNKLNLNQTHVYLHISNTSDFRKYHPVLRCESVVPIIDWFHDRVDNLYVELSNKTWTGQQFAGFRYIVKSNKPKWNKIVRKRKKIKEFIICEETPKYPGNPDPIPGYSLEAKTLLYKHNKSLVDIFKN